jgi:hypothetical protein
MCPSRSSNPAAPRYEPRALQVLGAYVLKASVSEYVHSSGHHHSVNIWNNFFSVT